MTDPRLLRRRDSGALPVQAIAHGVGGDDQQPVHAGEGRGQGVGLVEVGRPHPRATVHQVGNCVGPAGDQDDIGRVRAVEQLLGDKTAEVPGGSGEGDDHEGSWGR